MKDLTKKEKIIYGIMQSCKTNSGIYIIPLSLKDKAEKILRKIKGE